MSELQQLYQEVILDHNRNPRNYRTIENTDYKAEGLNPLCGDDVTIYLRVENNIVVDASFQGKGCAISMASASILTEQLRNKTIDECKKLFQHFHQAMTEDQSESLEKLGKLAVFEGVKDYPTRVKCATLAWHASQAALSKKSEPVTTE